MDEAASGHAPRMALRRSLRRQLSSVLEAAVALTAVTRPRKFAPFVLVVANGQILALGGLDWLTLSCAGVLVLASCSFGMRLNAWTDRELDRVTKPQLYRGLVKWSNA
jgi:4-hydroxybenzoate polyprenyltransferase